MIMLRIKDVKADMEGYFKDRPERSLVLLSHYFKCAIENEFYLLEERIKVKLLALEVCLDIDQTIVEYKSKITWV